MGTRKVKLTGIGYWLKVFEGNRDLTGFNDQLKAVGGQCTMDLDLPQEEFDKLKKAKFMSNGKPSPDNAGYTRVRLKRKWTEEYGGGAPTVLKEDGNVWDYDTDGPIGNGSEIVAIVNVYDTKTPSIVGARLEKLKVTKHKPYVRDDFDDVEAGVEDVAPKPKAKAASTDMDDEIPF